MNQPEKWLLRSLPALELEACPIPLAHTVEDEQQAVKGALVLVSAEAPSSRSGVPQLEQASESSGRLVKTDEWVPPPECLILGFRGGA